MINGTRGNNRNFDVMTSVCCVAEISPEISMLTSQPSTGPTASTNTLSCQSRPLNVG